MQIFKIAHRHKETNCLIKNQRQDWQVPTLTGLVWTLGLGILRARGLPQFCSQVASLRFGAEC